eukprot:SAG25_NODE_3147_length_1196_cov_1.542388_1_plen_351_part_00
MPQVNVLIASMGNSFTFVDDRKRAFVTFARAKIILELEHLLRRGELQHVARYGCASKLYICARVLLSCNIAVRSAPFLHVLEPMDKSDTEQDALKVKKPDFLLSMAASIGRIEGTAVSKRIFETCADTINNTIRISESSHQDFNQQIRREQTRLDLRQIEMQDQLSLLLQHFSINASGSQGGSLSLDSRRLLGRDAAQPFQNWQYVDTGYHTFVYAVEGVSPPIQVYTKLSAVDGHKQSSIRHFRGAAVMVAKHNDESAKYVRVEAKNQELANFAHENVVAFIGMCEGSCPHNDWASNLMLCFELCDFDLTIPIYNKQRGQRMECGGNAHVQYVTISKKGQLRWYHYVCL